MFKKLLGGGDKKPAPQPAPVDKSIKYEKTLHDIRVRRDKIQDDLDRIDAKVGSLDGEIRSLMSQKKKQQAMGKISEMKGYQKQIENLQTKYNMLTGMMIQIETLEQDAGIAETVQDAAELAKEQQETNDKLQDAMLDWQDFQTSQQETQELWKQMANIGVDQDELDDDYSKYEQEVNQQQAQKVSDQFNQVPTNKIPQQQQTQPQFVQPQMQNPDVSQKLSALLD